MNFLMTNRTKLKDVETCVRRESLLLLSIQTRYFFENTLYALGTGMDVLCLYFSRRGEYK